MNWQAGKAVAEALGPSLWVLAFTGDHDLATADAHWLRPSVASS
jgi:hypothetical protein